MTLRLLAFLAVLVAASPAQAKGWCDGSIRGRVFEDVNYGGGLGRDRSDAQADAPGFAIARPMAVVELYDSSGRFVADQITKSDGSYEFKNVNDGTYTVRVVNETVRSSRSGSTSALRAVQTFRVDGKGETGGTGRRRVGGERPQLVDAPARAHGQTLSDLQSLPGKYTQSIVRFRVSNAAVKNVDFGYNFDTIVNTNDAGQGSLRQFILNANTLRNTGLDQDDAPEGAGMVPKTPGFEHTIFMVPTSDVRWTANSGAAAPDGGTGDVFVIELASALPRIETDARTAIDGRTQTAYTGDTNPPDRFDHPQVTTGPEIVIDALGQFFDAPVLDTIVGQTLFQGLGVVNMGGTDNEAVGIRAWTDGSAGAAIRSCTSVGHDSYGFMFLATHTIEVADCVGREGGSVNHLQGDGLWLRRCSDIWIHGNTFLRNAGHGIDFKQQIDDYLVEDNLLIFNTENSDGISAEQHGGIAVRAGRRGIVRNNRIHDNGGDGILAVTNAEAGNRFSRNSIYDNGQLAIDLGGAEETHGNDVTKNDSGDVDSGPNDLLNFAVLESAGITGSDLVVRGFARPGNVIELFLAAEDPTGFGEGATFLVSTTEDGSGSGGDDAYTDTDDTSGTYGPGAVNGIEQGTDTTNRFEFTIPLAALPGVADGVALTATSTQILGTTTVLGQTVAYGNTSEFSGVVIVGPGGPVEHPSIGLAKNMTATGLGPFTVTIDYYFENFGDGFVSDLSMPDDMIETFGASNVTVTESPTLVTGPASFLVNAAWEGTGDLLAGGTLGIGETAQVRIVLVVTNPGSYVNQATVTGLSPLGAPVSDVSTAGTDPDRDGDDTDGTVDDDDIPDENDPSLLTLTSSVIGVAKNMSATGTGPFLVTIDYYLENFGGTVLDELAMSENFDDVFGPGNWSLDSAPSLVAGVTTVLPNPAFDGHGSDDELLAGGSLAPGETAQIQIALTVNAPGTYVNQVTVRATNPDNFPVTDVSTAGTDPDRDGDDTDGSVDDDGNPNEDVPTDLVLVGSASIGVAKSMTATGYGPFAVTIDYAFENFGIQTISNLSMRDDLDDVFGTSNWSLAGAPTLVSGPGTMTVNPTYTGTATGDELLGGGSLAPGETAIVRIQLTVVHGGTYLNQTTVEGEDPFGVPITDVSTDGVDPDRDGDDTDGSVDDDGIPSEDVPSELVLLEAVIGAAKDMNATGAGPFAVTIDYTFENFGDVPVTAFSAPDDLDEVFGAGNWTLTATPVLVSGPGAFTVNSGYTGTTGATDLLGGGSLAPGETAQVQIALTVNAPGNYENQVLVTGEDPDGGPVEDLSTAGTDPDRDGDDTDGTVDDDDIPDENDPTFLNLAAGVIGAAKAMTGTGTGPFAVAVDWVIENLGGLGATNLAMPDDLDDVFGSGNWALVTGPELVSGPATVLVNAGYTGDAADPDLFAAGGSLAPGESATVRVTLTVIAPGTYTNQTTLTGTTPGGDGLTDLSTAGSDPDPDGNGDPSEDEPTVLVLSVSPIASIGVAKDMSATGAGPFAVAVDYWFENFGTVTIDNLGMLDNLNDVFGAGNWTLVTAPILITGPATMTVNGAFTGDGSDDQILGGGSLAPGETARVAIQLVVEHGGSYLNQTTVTGTDPSSGAVSDVSTNGTDPDADGDNADGTVDGDGIPDENDPTPLVLQEGSIGVAKSMSATGSGPFAVTIDYAFENFGDLVASNLSMLDDLDEVFTAGNWTLNSGPTLVSGPGTMTVNGAFTGDGGDDELLGGGSLAPGETAIVRIGLTVIAPGEYLNQTTVNGETPGGDLVSDLSTDGTDPDADGDDTDGTVDSDGIPDENVPSRLVLQSAIFGVAKNMVATGTGPYVCTIDYTFHNYGPLDVESLSLPEELDPVFGSGNWTLTAGPALIDGPASLVVNGGYTGSSPNTDLLGGGSLAPDETGVVRIVVAIGGAGNYVNQVTVSGTDENGGDVEDVSTDGTDPDADGDDTNGSIDGDGLPNEDVPSRIQVEAPAIGLAKRAILLGVAPYRVEFRFIVANLGDVALENVEILDDLDTTFGAGNYVVTGPPTILDDPGGTLSPNLDYDGSANTNLLAPGGVLTSSKPGYRAEISVSLQVNSAGSYQNQALGRGVSALTGAPVERLSADGVNPAAPPDPTDLDLGPSLFLVTKEAAQEEVMIGDLVTYLVTAENTSALPVGIAHIRDLPAPGFQYVTGSAQIRRAGPDGTLGTSDDVLGPITPTSISPLEFDVSFAALEQLTVTYVLRVGGGVTMGEKVNRVTPFLGEDPAGNTATATVKVVPDPVFDKTFVIGKVFHDIDHDGYPDPDEPGIPGVRIATATGLLIETDEFGRYHVADVDGGLRELGRNFILKVDPQTLPPGAQFTTENPRVLRITSSAMNRIDFGVDPAPMVATDVTVRVSKTLDPEYVRVETSKPESTWVFPNDVLFATARAELRSAAKAAVSELAAEMIARPKLTAVIEGHADERRIHNRQFADNYELSQARAESVRKHLIEEHGIDPERLTSAWYGADRPRALGHDETAWVQNRRVDVKLFTPDAPGGKIVSMDPDRIVQRLTFDVSPPARVDGLTIIETLPPGMSYVPGSARWNNAPVAEPNVQSRTSGTQLEWHMTDVAFDSWNVMQIETRLDDLVFGQEYAMESRVSWTEGGATHTAPVLSRALEIVEKTDEPAGTRQAVAADVNFRSVHAEEGAGLGVLDVGDGAVLWATQDPSSPSPRLDILGPGAVHVEDGHADGPVSFVIDTNYAAWIDRWELMLYHGDDEALAHPIRLLTGSSWENGTRIEWDGAPNFGERLLPGHELQYVLRVFDEKDRTDETLPRTIFLAPDAIGDERARPETILGENHLRVQNIPVKGGAVRIHGTGLAPNGNVRLEGRRVPVDADGEFVYETILPYGSHGLGWTSDDADTTERTLDVSVSDGYFFLVGLADVTIGGNHVSGNDALVADDYHYEDDFYDQGRLAFYLRALAKGDVLITAHLDTHEEELENLFKNLDRKDPHRLFRQLDPDRYYPTFGDGSTTISDVDTQGRFYARIDWQKSRAMWGNFATGVTGTEYAHFNRSLYGGLLEFNSPAATSFGESRVTAIGFASEPNSAMAHNEFLGTGGSLYYLAHTDVVEGSEKVWVEVRDRDSGRITESITLERGRDYEFDDLQGRMILSRPLLQVADQAAPAIIKDTPLDGNAVVLIVDYEYVPTGFDADALTTGGRGEAWVEDHVKIGGTIIDEERDGQDYRMVGADVTLRGGAGTYLKGEYAKSEASQADTDVFSSDGGLSFAPARITLPGVVDPDELDGEAVSIEGRLDLADLGAGRGRPTLAGWWKHRDDDFSTAGLTNGVEAEDYGGEIQWSPWQRLSVAGRYSMLDRTDVSEDERVTGQARLRVGSRVTVGGELRRLSVTPEGAASTDALLGGVEVGVDVASGVNVYARGQGELDADDSYEDNQLATLGVRARVGEKLTARAEGSAGDRGESALVGADYNRDLTHHLYGTYTLSSDRIDGDRGIATFGQRKSLSNQVDLFSENQFTHGDRQSGIAHVYGLSYSPTREWLLGTTYQQSSLDTDDADAIDRRAVSATIGYRRPKALVSLRGELRADDGPVDRRQWLTANRADVQLTPSLKALGKLNYSESENRDTSVNDARFVETGLGLAYRPEWGQRFNFIGKHAFVYDLPSPGQSDAPDQRAHVFSGEALYDLTRRIEIGTHLAHKRGEVRGERDTGDWTRTRRNLVAARSRLHLVHQWDALGEYRWLWVDETEDLKQGALLGVYRHLGEYLKLGAGYNFTDFSDDLTDLDYDSHGWFVNFVGKY